MQIMGHIFLWYTKSASLCDFKQLAAAHYFFAHNCRYNLLEKRKKRRASADDSFLLKEEPLGPTVLFENNDVMTICGCELLSLGQA